MTFGKLFFADRGPLLRFGPSVLVHIVWWTWALLEPVTRFGRFTEVTPYKGQYYYMSITMVFGSLVAGSTSEGGGAIAYPVMSLLLGVPPLVARDFSFCIQSFGMTCASFTILGLAIPVDREAIYEATIGGAVGLIFGLVCIAPFLSPPYAKLLFVSVWMTFAVALFKLNARGRDRKVFETASDADKAVLELFSEKEHINQFTNDDHHDEESTAHEVTEQRQRSARGWILFFTGFFGGICSSVAGSGLDIATFSILTLYYRVSEKVATPTSVVLMAINAILGVFCRMVVGLGGSYADGERETMWNFVSVCIPVVVIGAPIGATIASMLARHWLAYFIYILNSIQFISALAIIKPWSKTSPDDVWLCVLVVVTTVVGSLFFHQVAAWGNVRGECSESKCEDESGCEIRTLLQSVRSKTIKPDGKSDAEFVNPTAGMV